jgi:hypothetical protein
MTVNVVTTQNLGADFDMGTQVSGKINVVRGSQTVAGKLRIATPAEITAGTAGVVPDAAEMQAAIAAASGGGGAYVTAVRLRMAGDVSNGGIVEQYPGAVITSAYLDGSSGIWTFRYRYLEVNINGTWTAATLV